MTMKEFINWLDEIQARYSFEKEPYERVYVYDKKDYEKHEKDPEAYVSYIRVSFHEGGEIYTRLNGLCGYMCETRLKEVIRDFN